MNRFTRLLAAIRPANHNASLRRLISATIVLAAAAAGGALLAPTPAQAAYSYPFVLISRSGNNLCLQANGTSAGSVVVAATCNNSRSQMWMLQNGDRLQNVAGYLSYKYGGYLDYDISSGTGNGRKVQVWHYIANVHNQKCKFGDLWGDVRSLEDGRCLDIDISGGNNPPRSGTRVQMYTCSGTANQRWIRSDVPRSLLPPGFPL
jgi:hypothetical protein